MQTNQLLINQTPESEAGCGGGIRTVRFLVGQRNLRQGEDGLVRVRDGIGSPAASRWPFNGSIYQKGSVAL